MSHPVNFPQKKQLTEAERNELAKKLDDDLDRFMEEMAAKKQSSNEPKKEFDFDEWCKEIDQHPAFMKELKDDGGEYSEQIQALQALKYGHDDEEADEDRQFSAEKHKKEGNKHFQLKKYRWAIESYTNGIRQKCDDLKLNAQLYFNRAASHKHIGNLRTAIKDCAIGRKFDPMHLKGMIRGAECLLELGYSKDALKWVDQSLKSFAFNKELSDNKELSEEEKTNLKRLDDLRLASTEKAVVEERDLRKRRAQEKKEIEEKKELLNALKERGLNLSPRVPFDRPELMDYSLLEVSLPLMHSHDRVKFGENKELIWPVLLQYPEVGQVDVLTDTNETTFFGELMKEVLVSPAEWDTESKFLFDNCRFFVTDEYEEFLMEVYEWTEFKDVFSLPGYQIKQGLPVIMVFTKEKVDQAFELLEEGQNKFVVK